MAAYYNEIEPFAAQWLRNLINARLIAPGEVDTRSIVDVRSDDLDGFTQCHFFAGIGGWSYALRLAGWPDDRPVWTGSCPCQPFSVAGKGLGVSDERHLWPVFRDLIRACRPAVVMGEQVAAAAGRDWLATVRADLEALGYEVGAADLCAASVGAPHIRQRLWFVADTDDEGPQGWIVRRDSADQRTVGARGLADFWSAADWLDCRDGKARPVEPGTFPLAHGVPARVGRLRAYGNAIVPQVAAEVIAAFMECRP